MSRRVHFEGKPYELLPEENLLDGLTRQGVRLASFCRTGVCQTCVVRATRGRPPASSQTGLSEAWIDRGCFLACQCIPSEALDVEACDAVGTFESRVASVEHLASDVIRVQLEAPSGFEYRAGQFLQLERDGGVSRPFSIASLPGAGLIELHVALRRGGAMSPWLSSALAQPIRVRGPFGECFYFDNEPERPLLLAGTGTGLAPLLGVTRAALAANHRAPIHLYHGSSRREGLYLMGELATLSAQAPTLSVYGSVLSAEGTGHTLSSERCQVQAESLDRLILNDPLDFAACRVYLCGGPEMVQRLRQRIYLSGAPRSRIHCDPFVAPGAK